VICSAKYLPQPVQAAVGGVMEHAVAVGADDGEVIECADRFPLLRVQGLGKVAFA
jgi:hypothetical protein